MTGLVIAFALILGAAGFLLGVLLTENAKHKQNTQMSESLYNEIEKILRED